MTVDIQGPSVGDVVKLKDRMRPYVLIDNPNGDETWFAFALVPVRFTRDHIRLEDWREANLPRPLVIDKRRNAIEVTADQIVDYLGALSADDLRRVL